MPRKKSADFSRSKVDHPPYRDMIMSALNYVGKSSGDPATLQSILEYIQDSHKLQGTGCELQVKRALGRLLKKGAVVQKEEKYIIGDTSQKVTTRGDYFTLPRKCKTQQVGNYRHISLTNYSGVKVTGKVSGKDIREFRPIAIVAASKRVAVEVTRLESSIIRPESSSGKLEGASRHKVGTDEANRNKESAEASVAPGDVMDVDLLCKEDCVSVESEPESMAKQGTCCQGDVEGLSPSVGLPKTVVAVTSTTEEHHGKQQELTFKRKKSGI